MTQADEIRQHAVQHYIEPARQEQRAEVTILAKDIRGEMGMHIDQTAVMSALTAVTFLDKYGLGLERLGEGQGWQGVRYRLSGTDYSSDQSMPRGEYESIPQHERELEYVSDWRERVLELPMGEFRELFSDYLKAKGFSDADVEIVIRMKGQQGCRQCLGWRKGALGKGVCLGKGLG